MKHATTKVYCIEQGTIVNMVPGGSNGKESACNAEDPGSIPGSGRSSGEGNGHVTLFEQHCSGLHHSLSVSLDDTVVLGDQGKASHITPLIYFRFTVR